MAATTVGYHSVGMKPAAGQGFARGGMREIEDGDGIGDGVGG